MKEESKKWIRPSDRMPEEMKAVEILVKRLKPDAKTHNDVIRRIMIDYTVTDFKRRSSFTIEYYFGNQVLGWRNISK